MRSGYAGPVVRGPVLRAPKFVDMPSLVILGGGPAGDTCATVAATLGADVTLIDATSSGVRHTSGTASRRRPSSPPGGVGRARPRPDHGPLGRGSPRHRCPARAGGVDRGPSAPADHHPARLAAGRASSGGVVELKGPHEVVVDTNGVIEELSADYILVATGSRPRVPDFVTVDRERVLTTRDRPAAGDPRACHRDRLGRHRGRVHPHVRRARLEGHAARLAPAGAADQGRRGRRGARRRVPAAGHRVAQGYAGQRDRARRRRRSRPLRGRPHRRRLARAARGRLDSRTAKASASTPPGWTSTAPATSR